MYKLFLSFTITAFLGGLQVSAQTLLHYWNFNSTTNHQSHVAPTVSAVSGAALDTFLFTSGSTSSLVDVANGTGQGFDANNYNARNGDAAGNHLRFNNPINGALRFSLPTTGFENVVVKYVSMRSASGAYFQFVHYTTDGVNYTLYDTIKPTVTPTLYTLDFSAVAAADNNANFKIRITFGQGGGGTAGNNRIDNFTIDGSAIGGGDITAPAVVFTPLDAATNVGTNVTPTLTFNEDIRLAGNAALNNTNVDTIVELRLNNATGAVIAFDAAINGNVITVTPNVALINNQQYYLVLKSNTIEDLSGNKITTAKSVTFTTIALQTIFQAGDIVPVAYRMSANGADDEVALLTLVDILPGTIINFTDAKYTDNAVAQCSGGLIWTAPAGGIAANSVITLKNDAGTVSTGTLTGGPFGLSSNGDQFIVYTGSNTSPSYITALSSNGWLTANTICTGSESKRPAALTDGNTAIEFSTLNEAVSGNMANAYYKGQRSGTKEQLRLAILNTDNWTGASGGTDPQAWPTWAFSNDTTSAMVSFDSATITLAEDASSAKISIRIAPYAHMNGKVVIKVTGGTGITAADYSTTPALTGDSLVLNVNLDDTLVAFTVNINNDTIDEVDEVLTFSISRLSERLRAGANAVCSFTITDNDTLVNALAELLVNGKQVIMFPNPSASGKIFFSEAVSAEVYDLTGKLLLQHAKTTELDVQTLSKGIYLVRMEGTHTRKLVIE